MKLIKDISHLEENYYFFNSDVVFNLENGHKSSNIIRNLKSVEGTDISKNSDILSHLSDFYQSLYLIDNCNSNIILNNIPCHNPLTHEQALLCDGKVSMGECWEAVSYFANGKSPGSDGLSAEFYKHYWPIIGDLVVNSLNYSHEEIRMSSEQGRGIISLIPKPNKDHTLVKNDRLISLLNMDYKIAAKALATRTNQILPYIINPNQTGFIKNRFIGENIRFVLTALIIVETITCQVTSY